MPRLREMNDAVRTIRSGSRREKTPLRCHDRVPRHRSFASWTVAIALSLLMPPVLGLLNVRARSLDDALSHHVPVLLLARGEQMFVTSSRDCARGSFGLMDGCVQRKALLPRA